MSSRLLTIAPVPSTANLHHLRIHLLPHPPSSRVSRLTTVSAPFLPVPPLRHLPCLPLCCSRASSRAEFIPPAKYPRVCLLISPSSSRFLFSLPPITILSARLSAFFLSFIIHSNSNSVYFVAHVLQRLRTRAPSSPFESPLNHFFASSTIFLLHSCLHSK